MNKGVINARFDRILLAMVSGPAPIARKKPSADQASSAEGDACCSDTQIQQDISEDDDRSRECESR